MKPPIQIVNEVDEVIGHKDRSQVDYSKDAYRVAALWITNSRGEVLIQQRVFTKKLNPGKWGPAVAGTLEEGETYDSNIYKEAEEEIGLTGVHFTKGVKRHVREPRHYFCQMYEVVVDRPLTDFRIQEEEVESLVWIPYEELVQDIVANPDKYVPTMTELVHLFKPLSHD